MKFPIFAIRKRHLIPVIVEGLREVVLKPVFLLPGLVINPDFREMEKRPVLMPHFWETEKVVNSLFFSFLDTLFGTHFGSLFPDRDVIR